MWTHVVSSGYKTRAPRGFWKSPEAEHRKGVRFVTFCDINTRAHGWPSGDRAVGSCSASRRPVGASLPPALGVSEVNPGIIFAACSSQGAVHRRCLGFCVLLPVFSNSVSRIFFFPSSCRTEFGAASTDTCLVLLRNLP